jgi:hypothetical protein
MDNFTESLKAIIAQCRERDMKLPFILAAVAINGSVLAIRAGEEEPEVLVERVFGSGYFEVPINIMIVDAAGDAVRVLVKGGGRMTFH